MSEEDGGGKNVLEKGLEGKRERERVGDEWLFTDTYG